MNRLPWMLWQRVPAAAWRIWPTAACALGDGAYLLRWPRLALAFPAGALVVGLALGAVHPGSTYSYSFAVVAVMAVGAALGTGVGLWILLGYVATDLVFTDRSSLPGFGIDSGANALTQAFVPLAMSYLLLALLLVVMPLTGSVFAVLTDASLRRAKAGLAMPAACSVYVGVVAALGYAWAQAMPFMIRPLWSFSGQAPDTEAVQPIQGHVAALCAVVAVSAIGRCLLTSIGAGYSRWPSPAPPGLLFASRRPTALRALIPVPFQAAFITLLLGGLVGSIWQGTVIFALLSIVLAARVVLVPLIPLYSEAVRKAPLLLRIGLCALISYLLADAIVQPAVDRGEGSFAPLLVAILCSLVAAALLLPGPGWQRDTGRAHGGQPSGWPRGHPPPAESSRPDGQSFAVARSLRLGRILLVVLAVQLVLPAPNAFADNCGDLSDCSTVVKIVIVVAAIVGIVIVVMLLPEIVVVPVQETLVPGVEALAGAVSAEEAAAAAAIAGLDGTVIASGAASELVSAEATIASGLAAAGGRLAAVLSAIQDAFLAAPPTTAIGALGVVAQGTAEVGLEPGVSAGVTAAGSIVLANFGNVTTFLFNNGQVLIMRGPQVLLNLIP